MRSWIFVEFAAVEGKPILDVGARPDIQRGEAAA
jgi:hypothetical protein